MAKGKSTSARIILFAPDGSIAVDAPVDRITNDPDRLAAHVARMEAQGFTILKANATGADLPNERAGQSRKFRNAWRWDGAKIEPDLGLARAQLEEEVRAERNAKLDAADKRKAQLDDLGTGPQKVAAARYRQELRDFPAQARAELDALGTAAELEAWEPSWPTE